MPKEELSLKDIQDVEFELLKKFIVYCDKNKLLYCLTYGTLLGAVRHHGFIPWDDDIDVMMPRKDYEELIGRFTGIEGCELIHRGNTEKYYYPFAKLCDTNTIAKMEDNNTVHGIWLDIFPVDSVPDIESNAKKFHRHIKFFKNLIISYTTDFSARNLNWKILPKFFFALIVKVIGIDKIVAYIENVSVKFNGSKSERVAIVNWQSSAGGNMDKNDIMSPQKMLFNNLLINVPNNYDSYLKSIYGDYMIIPTEKHRLTHHLLAYKKDLGGN